MRSREGASEEAVLAERRARMVESQIRRRGVRDERVLAAMSKVPRHAFVPKAWALEAYSDFPLPIGEGQTISQPYIVAVMTEALSLGGSERVLEIGTGSGYQTAILAELADSVWTVERSAVLIRGAEARLSDLGYRNVHFVAGDGTVGLAGEAPFDRIVATGSLPSVPEGLLGQLSAGGILVAPVGRLHDQELVRVERAAEGSRRRDLGPCRFVPLIGAGGWDEKSARSGFW
jgi:protein-L-isoaspartate(D-aspartate) O-methyltransferase